MGNYNSKYFDKKDGSLEEAIRMAVTKEIKEAKIVMDLENDDPKLIKDIKKFGLKVKDLGFSGNDGYNEYEVSGPQAKIDAANKKLNLMAGHNMNKMGEKLDPVNKKALKKDFDDRKDKDIDNDGDVDSSDKYLAKRRKAVSKAMQSEDMQTKSYINDIASAMKKDKIMKPFADKFIKDAMKTMNPKKSLEDVLPDYVAGKDIAKLLNMGENYDIGTPENTKSKLDATPGQSSDDWNQQVEVMQKKQASMREALAKIWGVDEGKNPFQAHGDHLPSEKKKKEEDKTMTGKPMTKVAVDPDMKEVKIGKKNISERLGKNYKYNKNFLFDDKKDTPMSVFKTMGRRPGGADYNQTELADYLAQKSGKDYKDVYFDDIELVYVDKTVGTMKQPIAKLIDALKKAR